MTDALCGMIWVAIGGAIGGPLRFFVSSVIGRRIGEIFPWGTLAVNVSGAFVIGGVAGIASAALIERGSAAWLLAVTGVLGSYTTVSSLSLQTLALVRTGERRAALSNVAATLALGLAAAAAGYALTAGLAA